MPLREVSIEQKLEYVAFEEHLTQTSSGEMYSCVCFMVSGAETGLWFWSVTNTAGLSGASGYAASRNAAMQLCLHIVESSEFGMCH
mgnify:CR=1 FL=1